jgi:hypothetical protein
VLDAPRQRPVSESLAAGHRASKTRQDSGLDHGADVGDLGPLERAVEMGGQ